MADTTSAASKNPYKGQSYDALMKVITGQADQIVKSAEAVAKCEKDPKTQRDVSPATDPAGLLLLALSAFRSEYSKEIRQFGGSDDQVQVVKKRAGEARQALRLAIKKVHEVINGLADASDFLDTARDAYATKHSDEMESKAKKLEEQAKKATEAAAKLRTSKGKRKSATA